MMKRVIILLLTCCMAVTAVGAERKRVGLVLGGGGAKGMAHIGVLKVLEEEGMPIDFIAGTSMGAIVGGLYAVGYNAAEIDSMVRGIDWADLLTDRVERSSRSFAEKEISERYVLSLPFGKERKDRLPSGIIRGQNLQNLFSNLTIGYHDGVDFNSFRIPFAAVAINLVDGKEKVFREGSLPVAMRASMAIPAAFTPVRTDSMVLVDGGLLNNYPADVALEMGADVLIGVDLGTSDLKLLEGLTTTGDVLGQIVALLGYDKYVHNKDTTDLLFRPDMRGYNSASFSPIAVDSLIRRGEQVARARTSDIRALKKSLGMEAEGEKSERRVYMLPPKGKETFRVESISYEGVDPRDVRWLTKLTKLQAGSEVSPAEMEEAMSRIVGTNAYANVSYKLTGERQQDLVLTVEPKPISSLNAGLRFDSEEVVAAELNATVNYRNRFRQKLAVTGRVGLRTFGRLDYSAGPNLLRHVNLSYMYTYHDLDLYHKGKKAVNTTYRHHLAELGYADMNWLNFRVKAGVRFEHFDYNDFLIDEASEFVPVSSKSYFNYFVETQFENFDRRYFPRRGVSLNMNYTVYTDNMLTHEGRTPFSALAVNASGVLPLSSRLSLVPSLAGRVLIGRGMSYPYLNAAGGESNGKYLPQQLAFAGINHVELFDNAMVVARIELRQRLWQHHYLLLKGDFSFYSNDFFDLFDGGSVWGTSFGYAYDSMAGPLSANFGYSDRSGKLQFYLNLGYYF